MLCARLIYSMRATCHANLILLDFLVNHTSYGSTHYAVFSSLPPQRWRSGCTRQFCKVFCMDVKHGLLISEKNLNYMKCPIKYSGLISEKVKWLHNENLVIYKRHPVLLGEWNLRDYYALGTCPRWGRQGMHTKFWWGNLLANVQLKYWEDARKTLRWMLGRQALRMGHPPWLMIVCHEDDEPSSSATKILVT